MPRPVLLVPRRLTADVEERLQREFDVVPPRDEVAAGVDMRQLAGEVDAICPTVIDRVDGDLLRRAGPRLRLVANFGVGYDNVDVAAARELGIVVTNTPDVLTEATADLAMTLLLMAARRAGEGERLVRSGNWRGWEPLQLLGQDVTGKTLGLVGFGRIGHAVAERAYRGFGMRILIYTRSPVETAVLERYGARQCGSLYELIENSHFVSLHSPGTPETRHLVDAAALRRFRPGAVLVNTARGTLIDEAALVEALSSGTLAAAGLDVYEREPEVHPGLRELENVVLLPHLGSATEQTRSAMGHRMLDNVAAFFAGLEPRDRVA
ncbi:MAG TPA: D-glycerate dehydrogenase [Woeseiaceae bacterium]|nr:D-glycerate dehydrogenase [Woeseiaceae bacterium]